MAVLGSEREFQLLAKSGRKLTDGYWHYLPFNAPLGNDRFVPKREAIHLEGKLFLNMFGSFSDFSKVK